MLTEVFISLVVDVSKFIESRQRKLQIKNIFKEFSCISIEPFFCNLKTFIVLSLVINSYNDYEHLVQTKIQSWNNYTTNYNPGTNYIANYNTKANYTNNYNLSDTTKLQEDFTTLILP